MGLLMQINMANDHIFLNKIFFSSLEVKNVSKKLIDCTEVG